MLCPVGRAAGGGVGCATTRHLRAPRRPAGSVTTTPGLSLHGSTASGTPAAPVAAPALSHPQPVHQFRHLDRPRSSARQRSHVSAPVASAGWAGPSRRRILPRYAPGPSSAPEATPSWVLARRSSADVQPGLLQLRWRTAVRLTRVAFQRSCIPGGPTSQLRPGRVDAPRRRVGAGRSGRGPASANHTASRADASVAADGADSRLRGLAFVDSDGAAICASGAFVQFSGRVAHDECAVVN